MLLLFLNFGFNISQHIASAIDNVFLFHVTKIHCLYTSPLRPLKRASLVSIVAP